MTVVPTPQELVEHALTTSRSDQAVAILQVGSAANLRWANNGLTTNGLVQRAGLTVVAFHHRPDGVAAASVSGVASTRAQAEALVAAADAAAGLAPVAEDAAPLVDGVAGPDWHLPPEGTSIAVFGEFAPQLGEAFARAADDGRILYGFVSHDVTTTYLGSTTGLRLRHVQPTGHYGATGKTADLGASAWVGGATRDFAGVDALALDAELGRRLAWSERRVQLPAGRYDTLLPPTAVADLMIYTYWSAGARTAHDGQSVFSAARGGTRIGDRVAAPGVHLSSDPGHPGLGCAPFVVASSSSDTASVFDNGLPLGPTDWLRDGELGALVQTRHSAALTGQPVTPGIDNLVLEVDGATGTLDELVAGIDRGLLLTCLWYIREVDPESLLLTGLTRDGVYLVEDGEVTAAVNNFRFNESPVDLLRRFSHAGSTEPAFSREWGDDYFSRTAMPVLRVPDFHMSSVSQAL